MLCVPPFARASLLEKKQTDDGLLQGAQRSAEQN